MAWVLTPEGWFDPVTNKLVQAPEGYNPAQYAPRELAEELASQLGGTVTQTEVTGPIKPPPQTMINIGGVELNAGLVADLYAKYPKELVDRMIQEELARAGVQWTPPASAPPVSSGISTTAVSEPQPIRAGEPAPTVKPGTEPPPPVKADPLRDLRSQMLAAAQHYGSDKFGWDQWNYIYKEVTGEAGPAPESRGYRREPNGLVLLDGKAMYPLDVWAKAAGIALDPQPTAPPEYEAPRLPVEPPAKKPTVGATMTEAEIDARVKALAREHGAEQWGWDQWGWFRQEVTGQPSPAPEDRGFKREADGTVLINGVPKYPYETWKAFAYPGTEKLPPPGNVPPAPPAPSKPAFDVILLGAAAIGLLALRGLMR